MSEENQARQKQLLQKHLSVLLLMLRVSHFLCCCCHYGDNWDDSIQSLVRITESGEPLWSKKSSLVEDTDVDEKSKSRKNRPCISAYVDRGDFDPNVAGGVA